MMFPTKIECENLFENYLTYVLQDILYKNDSQPTFVSASLVAHHIYGENSTYYDKERIDKILKDFNFPKYYEGYIIKKEDFVITGKRFVYVEAALLKTFVDHYKEFSHYLYILGSLDWNIKIKDRDRVVGHMPLCYFADKERVSARTIMRYNKWLEDNKVIYIIHGTPEDVNIYGRYADRGLISNYANTPSTYESKGNWRRSVSQKYAAFVRKNGEGYTDNQKYELYELCKEYNEDLLRQKFTGEPKDLSLFESLFERCVDKDDN